MHRSRKLETPPSSLGRSTDKAVTKKVLKNKETTDAQENSSKKSSTTRSGKTEKIQKSDQSLRKTNRDMYDTKKSDSVESKYSQNHNINNKLKQEHKSRTSEKNSTKDVAKEGRFRENSSSTRNKKDVHESKVAGDSDTNTTDTKLSKSQTTKGKANTRTETVKIIPKIENSTIDKSTTSREVRPRHGSKSRKSEYVINYDDKNGTVSSVRKLRSDSPRRKKTTKEVVKEKFKENLKNKTQDKAALRK